MTDTKQSLEEWVKWRRDEMLKEKEKAEADGNLVMKELLALTAKNFNSVLAEIRRRKQEESDG